MEFFKKMATMHHVQQNVKHLGNLYNFPAQFVMLSYAQF
jgi:hypothetical protein